MAIDQGAIAYIGCISDTGTTVLQPILHKLTHGEPVMVSTGYSVLPLVVRAHAGFISGVFVSKTPFFYYVSFAIRFFAGFKAEVPFCTSFACSDFPHLKCGQDTPTS